MARSRKRKSSEDPSAACSIAVKSSASPKESSSHIPNISSCVALSVASAVPAGNSDPDLLEIQRLDQKELSSLAANRRDTSFWGQCSNTSAHNSRASRSRRTLAIGDISTLEEYRSQNAVLNKLEARDDPTSCDELPPTQPKGPLKGIIAYVEVYSKAENRSVCVSNELRALGAAVSTRFTTKVTHVIFKEGLQSTIEKARARKIHLVSVLWLDSCKQSQQRVAESLFPVITANEAGTPVLVGRLRKQKSMQPKPFEVELALSADRISKQRKRAARLQQIREIRAFGPDSPCTPVPAPSSLCLTSSEQTPLRICLVPFIQTDKVDESTTSWSPISDHSTASSIRDRIEELKEKIAKLAESSFIADEEGADCTPVQASPSGHLSEAIKRRLFGHGGIAVATTSSNIDTGLGCAGRAFSPRATKSDKPCSPGAIVNSGTDVEDAEATSCSVSHKIEDAPIRIFGEQNWNNGQLERSSTVPKSSGDVLNDSVLSNKEDENLGVMLFSRLSLTPSDCNDNSLDNVADTHKAFTILVPETIDPSDYEVPFDALSSIRGNSPLEVIPDSYVEDIMDEASLKFDSSARCMTGVVESNLENNEIFGNAAADIDSNVLNGAFGRDLASGSKCKQRRSNRIKSLRNSHVVESNIVLLNIKNEGHSMGQTMSTKCENSKEASTSVYFEKPNSNVPCDKGPSISKSNLCSNSSWNANSGPSLNLPKRKLLSVKTTLKMESLLSPVSKPQENVTPIAQKIINRTLKRKEVKNIFDDSVHSKPLVSKVVEHATTTHKATTQSNAKVDVAASTQQKEKGRRLRESNFKLKTSHQQLQDIFQGPASAEEFKPVGRSQRSKSEYKAFERKKPKMKLRSSVDGPCGLVMTSLHKSCRETVKDVVKALGGFVLEDSVSTRTTHVVVGDQRRTLNLLYGMSRGCWIVSLQWILESMEACRWLPEDPFELKDYFPTVVEYRKAISANSREITESIFELLGLVYVSPKCNNPPCADVKALLQLHGVKLTNSPRRAKLCVLNGASGSDVPIVTETWVLDSITQRTLLPFDEYLVDQVSS